VYPSARGLSVFLLPLYGIFILGESISTVALLGCGLIIIGILMTGSIRISNFLSTSGRSKLLKGGIFSAILIGIIISLYSLVDKKAAPGIDPILFVWITDTSAVILFIYFYFTNKDLKELVKIEKFKLIIPGIFQYLSYGIVIYAYATTQLAYAGTFREVGTVFGAVFAKIFLKETFTTYKTLGILIIVVGAILISTF
jgi:drug/metabolite transporter (DMT)-like permease